MRLEEYEIIVGIRTDSTQLMYLRNTHTFNYNGREQTRIYFYISIGTEYIDWIDDDNKFSWQYNTDRGWFLPDKFDLFRSPLRNNEFIPDVELKFIKQRSCSY